MMMMTRKEDNIKCNETSWKFLNWKTNLKIFYKPKLCSKFPFRFPSYTNDIWFCLLPPTDNNVCKIKKKRNLFLNLTNRNHFFASKFCGTIVNRIVIIVIIIINDNGNGGTCVHVLFYFGVMWYSILFQLLSTTNHHQTNSI